MFKPRTPQDQATPAPQQADTPPGTQTPRKPTKPVSRPGQITPLSREQVLQALAEKRAWARRSTSDCLLARAGNTTLLAPEPGKPVATGRTGSPYVGALSEISGRIRARTQKKLVMDAWLDCFRQTGNQRVACEYAELGRTTLAEWIQKYPDFAARVEVAKQESFEHLEAIGWHRATVGTARPIWMKDSDGNPTCVDTVLEPSDRLMELYLKAGAPDKYRERTELTGANGSPLSLATQVVFQLPGTGREPKPVDVETVKQVADRP